MTHTRTVIHRMISPVALAVVSLSLLQPAMSAETDAARTFEAPPLDLPAPGASYKDPVFGTKLTRVARPADFNAKQLRPEYAQLQAWNADGSLMLLNSELVVETRSYRLVHKVDYRWPGFGQALRWSPTDPRKLYYIGGGIGGCADAGLYEYNLGSGASLAGAPTLVRCFSEYQSLYKDQSFEEISDDGRIIALVGKKAAPNKWGYVNEAFAYDIAAGIKHRPLVLPVDDAWGPQTGDFTAASPSGKYVLIQFPSGTSRLRGLEAFDLDMNYLGKVHTGSGHADFVRDASGTEWAVVDNANNAYLFGGNRYIVKAKIPSGVIIDSTGNVDSVATANAGLTVRLLQLDWSHHLHISCRNVLAPTWCVFSTYQTQETYDNGWQPFEMEVVKLYLDSTSASPKVERLAHHRSSPYSIAPRDACTGKENYWAQPHATVSPDGQQLVFGSNWGRVCDVDEPVDLFIAELGPTSTGLRPMPPKNFAIK